MASGYTNYGRASEQLALWHNVQPAGITTGFKLMLVTGAVTPGADLEDFGGDSFVEIAAGNGYNAGGIDIEQSATGFTHTQDDTNDDSEMDMKDVVVTASGGAIPPSGGGARWALLTDDNATVANRKIFGWADLGSAQTIPDTQSLTIQDFILRNKIPA